ncbi:MFS transporter [Enterovibrio sp. ZSDZ35]|uniref:MFS transporter n=1 Tax=Enterovibrio qingdaonensis TaxID=2899818 RepID=A0ABT5QPT3_9GAMM|nr:MFS transporter [Enterovibrio sp. ZSDZ35]MDD1782609.1 MFS transporter [Enterovibrio sp. ZSDZ35]
MTSDAKIPARGWAIVWIAWLAFMVANLSNFAFGVILPDMRNDIGFDLETAGWLSAIAWVGKGLLTIPIICFISKGKPKTVLFSIFVLLGIGMIMQGYATNVTMLFVGRLFVMGVAAGIVSVLVVFKIQWIPKEKLGSINGVEMFTGPAGQMLGTAAFPMFLAMMAGWREVMIVMGVFALILAAVWMVVAKDNSEGETKPYEQVPVLQPLKEALQYKNTWILAIAWPMTSLTWIAVYTFWPTYAVESLSLSIAEAGMVLGLLPIGSAIACLVSPVIAQKWGYDKPLIVASGVVLPVAYYSLMLTDNVLMLSAATFIAGYAAYNFVPLAFTTLYKTDMSPRAVSMGTGFIFSLVGLGGAAGGAATGWLGAQYGLETALSLTCITPGFFAVLTMFLTETGWKAEQKNKAQDNLEKEPA